MLPFWAYPWLNSDTISVSRTSSILPACAQTDGRIERGRDAAYLFSFFLSATSCECLPFCLDSIRACSFDTSLRVRSGSREELVEGLGLWHCLLFRFARVVNLYLIALVDIPVSCRLISQKNSLSAHYGIKETRGIRGTFLFPWRCDRKLLRREIPVRIVRM